MKKKLLGIVFFFLAAMFLGGGISAGGNGILGGVVLALVFVFLGLKQFGVIRSKGEKHGKAGAKVTDPTVWVAAGSEVYHASSICQHIYGTQARRVDRSEARAKGLRPCKNCYPYGD